MRIWKFVAKDFLKQNSEVVSSDMEETNINDTRLEDIDTSTMTDSELQNSEEQLGETDSSSEQEESMESSSESSNEFNGDEQNSEKSDSFDGSSLDTEESNGKEQDGELGPTSEQGESIESSSEGSDESNGEEQNFEESDAFEESSLGTEGSNGKEQDGELGPTSEQGKSIENSSEGLDGSTGIGNNSGNADSFDGTSLDTEGSNIEEQDDEFGPSSEQGKSMESSSEGLDGSTGIGNNSGNADSFDGISLDTEGSNIEEQDGGLGPSSEQGESMESSSEGSDESNGEEQNSEESDAFEESSLDTEGSNGKEQDDELGPTSEQGESIEESSEGLNDFDDMEQSHEIKLNKDDKVEQVSEMNVDNQEIDSKESEVDSDEIVDDNAEVLSLENNQFLQELKELPSFKDRERGDGYSIDTDSLTELPDSLVRTLIIKFLNQRFCNKASDLNHRSTDLEKSYGFYKWDLKKVIFDYTTYQYTKVLRDKYGYQYANGRFQNVPLSFYFDMSTSMSSYTNMLAVLAIELLKKDVKVLIGFNERVNVQIDSLKQEIDVSELASILCSAGYSSIWGSSESFKKDSRVEYKFVNQDIDQYLIEKKAEKCVVFADFDPLSEVVQLSQKTDVYWFCFETDFERSDLEGYKGFLYPVQDANDIVHGLIKVNERRFENLCFVENSKVLKKGGE